MKKLFYVFIILLLILAFAGCDKLFPPHEFKVSFDPSGGELVSGELEQTVAVGEAAEAPRVRREGYDFAGWEGDYSSVSADTVITAKWDRLFTVTCDAGEGQISGKKVFTLKQGEMPEAPSVTRDKYELVGWEPALAPASGDVTYTAVWAKKKLNAQEVFALVSPSVIEIHGEDHLGQEWLGSAFFINDSGVAVTNFHVMVGAVDAKAVLSDGTELDVTGVYGYDQDLDLCLIQVDTSGNEFLTISETEVVTGSPIYAIGSSLGYTGSLSDGIVSSASRIEHGTDYIQITAPISPGNSGGPLVNEYGEVMGVNAMQRTDGQNMNFAVNIRQMDELSTGRMQKLEQFSKVVGTDHVFYSYYPYAEHESNNAIGNADMFEEDGILAAELSDKWDRDYFGVHLNKGQTVTVLVMVYSDSDDFGYLFGRLDMGAYTYIDVDFSGANGIYDFEYTADRDDDYYLMIEGDWFGEDYPMYYWVMVVFE